jgi:hypothetical protein
MIALETLKELHGAGRLDLIVNVAQYSGQYQQMVDKQYGIIRSDAFNYGSNTPTISNIKFI